jgi:hypothetical protein
MKEGFTTRNILTDRVTVVLKNRVLTVFFFKIYCTENHWYTLDYKIVPNTNLSYKSDLSPAGG